MKDTYIGFVDRHRDLVINGADPEQLQRFHDSFKRINRRDLFADEVDVWFQGRRYRMRTMDLYGAIAGRNVESVKEDEEEEIVSGNNNGYKTNPFQTEEGEEIMASKAKKENVAPGEEGFVKFPESKLNMTCYYHGVIVSLPYIILAWNIDTVGFPKVFPEKGSKLKITVLKWGLEDILVMSLGSVFKHAGFEYCILVEIPEDLDKKIEEARKEQEQQEKEQQE